MARLDHLSIVAPFSELERAGFRITRTPGTDGEHARILLDRMYVEVSRAPQAELMRGVGWFVAGELSVTAEVLAGQGIAVSQPVVYRGADGEWLDVTFAGEPREVALPVLTKRTDLEEWPPPLIQPHPNGAVAVSAVHLNVEHPGFLSTLLRALKAKAMSPARYLLSGVEITLSASSRSSISAVAFSCMDQSELRLKLAN